MVFSLFLNGLEHCVSLALVLHSRSQLSQFFYFCKNCIILQQTWRLTVLANHLTNLTIENWTVVGRGYFLHNSSHSQNVASACRVNNKWLFSQTRWKNGRNFKKKLPKEITENWEGYVHFWICRLFRFLFFIFFNSSMHMYFLQINMTSYVIITHLWQCVPLLFLANCRTYSTYKSLVKFDLMYSFLSTGSWTVLLPRFESWKLFLFAQRSSHLQYSD